MEHDFKYNRIVNSKYYYYDPVRLLDLTKVLLVSFVKCVTFEL